MPDETEELFGSLRGGKLLLAASTGGHLAQLVRLSERFDPDPSSLWLSFDKPQSRSLLSGRRHAFVPYIAPRQLGRVLRTARTVNSLVTGEHFDAVLSTGAAIALSTHLVARARGTRTIYIESVSRFDGPSLTGRILERVPGIERYSQHPYPSSRWRHEFSVLDTYHVDPAWAPAHSPRRIFVTLGTIHPYRFDALVDALLRVASEGAEFVWQLGCTERNDLPGESYREMSAQEFDAAVADSDLVVTHAGVGTVMSLLDASKPILVVPRRKHRREHVDDHQLQIVRELRTRGLAVTAEATDVDAEVLLRAASVRAQ